MEKVNSYIICLNNKTVYQGVREAERATGVNNSNISKVCRNKRKNAGGLRFEYFNPVVHKDYKYYDRSSYDRSV